MVRGSLCAVLCLFLAACSGEDRTYSLDMEDAVEKMRAVMDAKLAEAPEESRAMAKNMLEMQFAAMVKRSMHMTLGGDGSYRMESVGEDGDKRELVGTWTRRGDDEIVARGVDEATGKEDEKLFKRVGDDLVLTQERSPLHIEMIFRLR